MSAIHVQCMSSFYTMNDTVIDLNMSLSFIKQTDFCDPRSPDVACCAGCAAGAARLMKIDESVTKARLN